MGEASTSSNQGKEVLASRVIAGQLHRAANAATVNIRL